MFGMNSYRLFHNISLYHAHLALGQTLQYSGFSGSEDGRFGLF